MSVGVAFRNGTSFGLGTGFADTALDARLRPDDLLLAGSVGKTYVAAVALQLEREGRMRLEEPIATYLGREPWFSRLPNGAAITVRMLMNHTSGLDEPAPFAKSATSPTTDSPSRSRSTRACPGRWAPRPARSSMRSRAPCSPIAQRTSAAGHDEGRPPSTIAHALAATSLTGSPPLVVSKMVRNESRVCAISSACAARSATSHPGSRCRLMLPSWA